MTTDTAEAVVAQPEVPVVAEPTPESAPATPAAEETKPDLKLVLAEYGEEVEEETGSTPATPTEATAKPLTPEAEAAVESFKADLTKQAQTQQRQAEEQGIRRSFEQRKPAIQTFLLNLGVQPEDVQKVVNEFDYHHGQSARLRQMDIEAAKAEVTNNFFEGIKGAALEVLPAAKRAELEKALPEIKSNKDFLEKFLETSGYLSPKEAKKQSDARMLAFTDKLYKEGRLNGSKGLEAGTSQGHGGSSSYTLDQIEAMSASDWNSLGDRATRQAILDAAHARAGR